MIKFDVIDKKTGGYPDCEKIALSEEWAKGLVYCDIDGFYIGEDGTLILVDDCGNCACPPADRFIIRIESEMANELISRKVAINHLTKARLIGDNRPMTEIFSEIPTVEAELVKHGKWLHDMGGYWCSICDEFHDYMTYYCPSCGAKLQGDKEEMA